MFILQKKLIAKYFNLDCEKKSSFECFKRNIGEYNEIIGLNVLKHPNIIKLVDYKISGEQSCTKNLFHITNRGSQDLSELIDMSNILGLIYDMVLSINFIHSNKILHNASCIALSAMRHQALEFCTVWR